MRSRAMNWILVWPKCSRWLVKWTLAVLSTFCTALWDLGILYYASSVSPRQKPASTQTGGLGFNDHIYPGKSLIRKNAPGLLEQHTRSLAFRFKFISNNSSVGTQLFSGLTFAGTNLWCDLGEPSSPESDFPSFLNFFIYDFSASTHQSIFRLQVRTIKCTIHT